MNRRRFVPGRTGLLGTLVMAYVAALLAILEWDSTRFRVPTVGLVVGRSFVAARSGNRITEIRNDLADRSVFATLRTWYYDYNVGERVALLTSPTNPADVVAASFWQQHYASMTALFTALGFAIWEISTIWKRPTVASESILGDNPDQSDALRCLEGDEVV